MTSRASSEGRSSTAADEREECCLAASEILLAAAETWRYHYANRREVVDCALTGKPAASKWTAGKNTRLDDNNETQEQKRDGDPRMAATLDFDRTLAAASDRPREEYGAGDETTGDMAAAGVLVAGGATSDDGGDEAQGASAGDSVVRHPTLPQFVRPGEHGSTVTTVDTHGPPNGAVRAANTASHGDVDHEHHDHHHHQGMESTAAATGMSTAWGETTLALAEGTVGGAGAGTIALAPNGTSGAAAKKRKKALAGVSSVNSYSVQVLLEARYLHHRRLLDLMEISGRQMYRIVTQSKMSAATGAADAAGDSAAVNESVLPFRFSASVDAPASSNPTASTTGVQDRANDRAFAEFHALALQLARAHADLLGLSELSESSTIGSSSSALGDRRQSVVSPIADESGAGGGNSGTDPDSSSSPGGAASDGGSGSSGAVLRFRNPQRTVAAVRHSRTRHVIDLDFNVYIRVWKNRREARFFVRGLAALHEAKSFLLLPPSLCVPYTVLIKGPKHVAISVTWMPPLDSAMSVTPPKGPVNFTNFCQRAWREAVYPNLPESKTSMVTLCNGADGCFYAMCCGIDDASTGTSGGGMILDDLGSQRSPTGTKFSVLMDARRAVIEPKSTRHYQQARQVFQRISAQLATVYSTHLMYLSMMSYLHGALFSGSENPESSVQRAVRAVVEFATSLPKEETPLAMLLYNVCGELVRFSTFEQVKRIAKKLVNTTIFQPKLHQWQMDTRIVSDVCAITVSHILEARDDPISLRKTLESRRVANVAITDICCTWGMNLADAQIRFGHSRTLNLFSRVAFETALPEHQGHLIPEIGVRPPKPVAEGATEDRFPITAEVGEVVFGVLQPLFQGIDLRRGVARKAAGAANGGAIAKELVQRHTSVNHNNTESDRPSSVSAALPRAPVSFLLEGEVQVNNGIRVVDPLQLGGWSLCYVAALLHESRRHLLVPLVKLIRILRYEPHEAHRLVAKALAVMICALAVPLNFFDTNLIKRIIGAGCEVIQTRCADREMMTCNLRFLETESVSRHMEMLISETQKLVERSAVAERAAILAERQRREEREIAALQEAERQRRMAEEVQFHRRRWKTDLSSGRSGKSSSGAGAGGGTSAAVSGVVDANQLNKVERKLYSFLADTMADPIPMQESIDEVLAKPFEPAPKAPSPPRDGSDSDGSSTSSGDEEDDENPTSGDGGPGIAFGRRHRSHKSTRHHHQDERLRRKRRKLKKRERQSKYDIIFRTIAMYREEEHLRSDLARLEALHFSNLEVRFACGVRSVERRLLLRARLQRKRFVAGDDVDSGDGSSGSSSSSSSRASSPPRGLSTEQLAEWKAVRKAERAEKRRREKILRREENGKEVRFRKGMQEVFPGGFEDLSKADRWPNQQPVHVRFVLNAFVLYEEERKGRATYILQEFEEFSSISILFDAMMWDL